MQHLELPLGQLREPLALGRAGRRSADEARVGVIDATFLTTATGVSARHDGSEQLSATVTLADGSEIAVQGIVGAFARTTHVAIVGGTGRYAGARGQVTARFTPRSVHLHLQLSR